MGLNRYVALGPYKGQGISKRIGEEICAPPGSELDQLLKGNQAFAGPTYVPDPADTQAAEAAGTMEHERRRSEERASHLERECSALASQVASLRVELDRARVSLDGEKAALAKAQSDLVDQRRAESRIQGDLRVLQQELSDVRGRMASLESDKKGLQVRVAEMDAAVKEMEAWRPSKVAPPQAAAEKVPAPHKGGKKGR
jgi:chromosome segregation ATPase